MRMKSAIYVWGFTAIFILVAGCISLGSNNSPGATLQSPSATVAAGGSNNAPQSLTDAQKDQAVNIAKSDSRMKEILGRQGYSVTGVFSGGAGNAVLYVEGGSTVHSDGSIWTPDMYQVTVDISGNKVTDIKHFESKVLPTPTATH